MGKLDTQHFERRLREERDRLTATSKERAEAGDVVVLDQQRVGRLSRMDALQMQAMARAEVERATLRLQLIGQALERIDAQDYGRCRECDKPIAEARLEVDPAAALCITCAELAD